MASIEYLLSKSYLVIVVLWHEVKKSLVSFQTHYFN